ncbi:hypothetical protein [Roseiconus lacunae]|uniref:hypothetical protein n=1 Tax=Roseiconus lacunae TaxID=2605694 RepID=UPI001E35F6E7|nr:hypothetical protein [Roseiconus lacunae]MCD0459128.1 hypothetical protein [Roseiconus lacunae]
MLKRAKLAEAINSVRDTVERWNAADNPVVRWRNGPRKAVSEHLMEGWFALFGFVATMDAESSIKPTILAIDKFQDELEQWVTDCDIAAEETDPHGSVAMWSAWTAVLDAFAVKQRKKPEPIASLVVQNVSDRQIAMIYGFKDENGDPDLTMVAEEKAKPGTHYDPDTWIHPSEARLQSQIEAEWSKREAIVDQNKADSFTPREAPESIEELINQRVSASQIAQMKNVSIERVQEIADEIGLPIDGQISPPSQLVSPSDQLAEMRKREAEMQAEIDELRKRDSERELQSNQENDPPTLIEQVSTLAASGKKPGEIASELKPQFSNLTAKKVEAMLKKAQQPA